MSGRGPVDDPSVAGWLHAFVEAVRANDISAGRQLFDDSVIGFGSLQTRAEELDQLVEGQWKPTWAQVHSWDLSGVTEISGPDADQRVVAFSWTRVNVDGTVVSGRATLVLVADGDNDHGWRCVHSHFSANPVSG